MTKHNKNNRKTTSSTTSSTTWPLQVSSPETKLLQRRRTTDPQITTTDLQIKTTQEVTITINDSPKNPKEKEKL
jgi:hypothetical protein